MSSNHPLVIGLTGGIGSGKSTIAKVFQSLHIPCYYADDRAKSLMNESSEVKDKLTAKFGSEVYKDGTLNRPLLAELIFNNDENRAFVNNVVHPAVAKDFEQWTTEQEAPYVLKEAAILFETGGYKASDFNILVTAPVEVRLQRVMSRDSASAEQVKARMNAQWPDEKKTELADFVILNDGVAPITPQVQSIHEALLSRSN